MRFNKGAIVNRPLRVTQYLVTHLKIRAVVFIHKHKAGRGLAPAAICYPLILNLTFFDHRAFYCDNGAFLHLFAAGGGIFNVINTACFGRRGSGVDPFFAVKFSDVIIRRRNQKRKNYNNTYKRQTKHK